METSLTGLILIWAGVLASLFRPAWLPSMTIFTLPFSAVAVLNIAHSGGYSGIQVSMFYGSLWLLHRIGKKPLWDGVLFSRESAMSRGFFLLGAFCLAALSSMLMPFFIREPLLLQYWGKPPIPYVFSLRNITQFLYLLYGCLLAWAICDYIRNREDLRRCIRACTASALVMALWGLFQFMSYNLGVPYPTEWIHTNLNISAHGYDTTLTYGGIVYKRISSAATEPSLYAQSMLVVLPWILAARLNGVVIWNEWVDSFTGGLLIVTLVLSTAASAYAGLAWLVILLAVWLFWKNRGRIICCLGISLLVIVLGAFFTLPAVHNLISYGLLEKLTLGSGQERMYTVKQAAAIFAEYPVWGIGWGSLTVHDLFFNILGNTGLTGGITFWLFAGWVSRKSVQGALNAVRAGTDYENSWIASASTASFLTLLFLNLATGFMYTYGHFWFVTGVAIRVLQGCQFGCGPESGKLSAERIRI